MWPTVEHYFQAQKFAGTEDEEIIRLADTPLRAKEWGRDPGQPIRSDWNKVKDDILYEALCTKFQQHPELASLLLETNDAVLIEDNPYDSYWGNGKDGNGANRMGRLLMKLRTKLRKGLEGGSPRNA
jgi:ribA/ribD-fused uncharacterized protein